VWDSNFYPKLPGYPACAGIDPYDMIQYGYLCWLPRMRGDRPGSFKLVFGFNLATPHARGSTLLPPRHPLCHHGYPACAGIDLSCRMIV